MMNSQQTVNTRLSTWIWMIMMLLSLVTYVVGHLGLSGLNIALGVLVLALIKGYLVGAYFMGLRHVRGFWRWPVAIWLLLPGLLITIAFVLAEG